MTSPHHPLSPQVQTLMNRGVTITQPLTVEIGEDVALDRIATTGVELRGAVRIEGSATSIGPHCRLGTEGPVVLVDCQLGSRVELGGGYFTSAVIHEGVRITNGAHVREACLLEEKVKIAHSVGLKHTVLFPYVTLGSLINFCDCLMAGGTGEKNHSEVGSSFIHFNFTPNQDKATASLLGDVPHGVMVDQPPIFLGGQGGIVGPLRLGYGTVTKAGAIIRRDYPDGGCIVGQGQERGEVAPFYPGLYLDVTRRVGNNIFYLANILALRMWYQFIRQPFMQGAPWSEALSAGAMKVLSLIIHERRRRVKELMEKMDTSIRIAHEVLSGKRREQLIAESYAWKAQWPAIDRLFTSGIEEELGRTLRERFLSHLSQLGASDYLAMVTTLKPVTTRLGTQWLQAIVDGVMEKAMALFRGDRSS